MKNSKIILGAVLFSAIVSQSCDKEYLRIEGTGSIVTRTLTVEKFSGISIEGADDVFISYGQEQRVEVRGHSNIIDRIEKDVNNGVWDIELENGNYSNYELTYYITIPTIDEVSISGSANVHITDAMETGSMDISLVGSGSFYGYLLSATDCQVDITGSGNCEIRAINDLDVNIDGSGSVYYKGSPSISTRVRGSGQIVNAN